MRVIVSPNIRLQQSAATHYLFGRAQAQSGPGPLRRTRLTGPIELDAGGAHVVPGRQLHLKPLILWRLRALALRQSGAGQTQAEAALQKALASARQGNAKSLELRAAMAWARQGREGSSEAGAELARVYEWFGEGRDTRDLTEAEALLRST